MVDAQTIEWWCPGPRVSWDGSKVFLLDDEHILAWSTQTGGIVGKVGLDGKPPFGPLIVDGSRVWVRSGDLQTQGWNFGVPGPVPTPLFDIPPDRPHLSFIDGRKKEPPGLSVIQNTVNGEVVF